LAFKDEPRDKVLVFSKKKLLIDGDRLAGGINKRHLFERNPFFVPPASAQPGAGLAILKIRQ
jgi:hypothetical protein